MKKLFLFLLTALCLPSMASAQCGNLYIAGVFDGPLGGGTPKGIQLCATGAIADLSIYGVGSATNGGGTDGEEFTFPAVALNASDCIWVASEAVEFLNYFGFAPDYTTSAAGINGDDAVEMFCSGAVEDVFGDINTLGDGECWDYTDGYATNNNTSGNGGTFDCADWTFSGIDAVDGCTTDATCANSYLGGTTVDCPGLGNVGDACDDGDASTTGDVVIAGCTCEGTPTGLATCAAPAWEVVSPVTNTSPNNLGAFTAAGADFTVNGYCGSGCAEQVDTWIVYGPLDMTGVTTLNLGFDLTEQFGNSILDIQYTTDYSSACPTTATWVSAATADAGGTVSTDLSTATGTAVYIAIQYNDDGADGYSSFTLSNFSLTADVCPTVGTAIVSDCGTPTFDCPAISANFGDACTDTNGAASTIANDCSCTIVCPTFGDACTDTDGDASTIDGDCACIEVTVGGTADVFISELSYNPCTAQGNDTECEYIIITNSGASIADISDYTISNAFDYTFPVGTTIAAGGTLSLGITGACAGLAAFDLSGSWTGNMSNSSETVELNDAAGTLIFTATYDDATGADGDCDAICIATDATTSACASSLAVAPTFDCPAISANFGDACDDNDAATTNDVVLADCSCAGTIPPTFDCPAISADFGDACTDANGAASTVANDCSCTVVCPTFGDACTDTDGDASTIDADCACIEVTVGGTANVFISELSYNPCTTQGGDTECEYIVLTNDGTGVADISDYTISNAFDYTFPTGTTIAVGETLSLGISGTCAGLAAFDLSGGWVGNLNNSSETIELNDATGALIFTATYDDATGADGDCDAICIANDATTTACASSLASGVVFDCPALNANFGDACTDVNGAASTIDNNCNCTEVVAPNCNSNSGNFPYDGE